MTDFDKTGLEAYITDETMEGETGLWIAFPNGRRIRILRAGGSNKRFTRAFQTAIRPYERAMKRGTMDQEVSEGIMRELYARYVVVAWDGINDADGDEVPFTTNNVVGFFDAFPEIFNELVTLASNAATFSEEMIAEAREAMGEA